MRGGDAVITSSRVSAIGQRLFRWRGWLPAPVIALLLWVVAGASASPGPGGAAVDGALKVLGVVFALAGESLRFFTLGQVPEGTSGQGYALEASALNTRGPYAYVRNPLYLGNLGICAGLLLVANNAWTYVIGLGFFSVEYFFIIRAEESFLREKYGQRFEEYASSVPRWLPRLAPVNAGRLRSTFDWARALKKEHNPFALWASAMLLLLVWQSHRRGLLTPSVLTVLLSLEAVVLIVFATTKAFKRGWFRAR
ncbi:MAG TPA: isoprenylcysteine carboxylmethyltransferase family protein [Myxococcaceae bacterium]|nr:isoprenylcysteine carboxylmethyltransferase family protein [Myxococcaceae bacterium]